MPNQAGEIEEALDKLASVLGFVRGSPRENEFWVSLTVGNSVVQQLASIKKQLGYLSSQCIDLDIALGKKRDR